MVVGHPSGVSQAHFICHVLASTLFMCHVLASTLCVNALAYVHKTSSNILKSIFLYCLYL